MSRGGRDEGWKENVFLVACFVVLIALALIGFDFAIQYLIGAALVSGGWTAGAFLTRGAITPKE